MLKVVIIMICVCKSKNKLWHFLCVQVSIVWSWHTDLGRQAYTAPDYNCILCTVKTYLSNISYFKIVNIHFFLQSTFQFALIWSVGGTVDTDGRTKFDAYMREIMSGKSEYHPMPADVGAKIEVPIPENGLVYDFVYEVR